ncbi:MAG: glycosyltransferase family 39 protein [Thermaerobacter sp.]|nr:glycosyltransferase family 39 protein [Thermaerobacter sp.]
MRRNGFGLWEVGAPLFVFVLATALRAWFAAYHQLPVVQDMLAYDTLARNLATGHGFAYLPGQHADTFYPANRGPTAFRPPLYPVLLAAIYLITDFSRAAVYTVQSVLGGATAVLAWLLARQLGARPLGALAAGILVGIWPNLLIYSSLLLTENLLIPLLLAAVFLAVRARAGARPEQSLALAGTAAGLAVLTQPGTVLPLTALGLLGAAPLAPWRPYLRRLAAYALPAVLLAGLWIARDWAVFHTFVPVVSDGGVTLYFGNSPSFLAHGWAPDFGPAVQRAVAGIRGEIARNAAWQAQALRFIAANPARFLALALYKAVQMWNPVPVWFWGWVHPPEWFNATAVPYLTLAADAAAFAALATRRGEGWSILTWMIVLWTASMAPFLGDMRFLAPSLPLVLTAAGAGPVRPPAGRLPRLLVAGGLWAVVLLSWLLPLVTS